MAHPQPELRTANSSFSLLDDFVAMDNKLTDSDGFCDAVNDACVRSVGNLSYTGDDDLSVATELAKKESSLVRCSTFLVVFSLLSAAGICCVASYAYTFQSESKEFRKQFENYALQTIQFSQIAAKDIFDSINAMSSAITSYSVDKDAEWPFYTIPDFDRHGSEILQRVGSRYIWFAPFVTEEKRDDWEEWSVANQEKLIYPYIHRRDWRYPVSNFTAYRDEVPADPFYAPSWQGFPFIPPTVNWNAFDLLGFPESFEVMYREKKAVYSRVTNLGAHSDGGIDSWPQNRLITPVLDNHGQHSKVVAFIGTLMQWHQFLVHILPTDTKLLVTISNGCGQKMTYDVDGPNVIFVGETDAYEKRFEEVKFEADFFEGDSNTIDFCGSKITIYPTTKFYRQYHTFFPLFSVFMVLFLFATVSAVFVCYVLSVERRQATVLDTAVKSKAIVSSLFPRGVRSRLNEGVKPSSDEENLDGSGGLLLNNKLLGSDPIAELFENATILFADMVGFTSWSSSREPIHVFTLLEQVYNAFDRLAKRRGVFKVETIGDCYVAVTGLPKPRKDHCECMAKFARECRAIMPKVVGNLAVRLGPETKNLDMRFGIHSGPVTAGVLRGEKSRFQLFGDSVNVAARIEATGERNRIHLSQASAQVLIARGKSSWVEKRTELVNAKGKGNLQTYWLITQTSDEASADKLSLVPDNHEEKEAETCPE